MLNVSKEYNAEMKALTRVIHLHTYKVINRQKIAFYLMTVNIAIAALLTFKHWLSPCFLTLSIIILIIQYKYKDIEEWHNYCKYSESLSSSLIEKEAKEVGLSVDTYIKYGEKANSTANKILGLRPHEAGGIKLQKVVLGRIRCYLALFNTIFIAFTILMLTLTVSSMPDTIKLLLSVL